MVDEFLVQKDEQDKPASKVMGRTPDDPARQKDDQDNYFSKDTATLSGSAGAAVEAMPPKEQQSLSEANNDMLSAVRSNDLPTPEKVTDVCEKAIPLVERCTKYEMPEIASIRMDNLGLNSTKLHEKIKHYFSKRIEEINQAAYSKDNEKELNRINRSLNALYRLQHILTRHADHFRLLLSTVSRLQKSMEEERIQVDRILHVANIKDYIISDLDSSAKMEEDEGSSAFMVNDTKQSKLITQMKAHFSELIADLSQITADFSSALSDKMDEQGENIRTMSDQKLKDAMRETAYFEKKFIKSISDKKLQQKLKAEMTVLAYLIKHPNVLSKGRLADIRDAINKIKWQAMPFQPS
jgi:hypothetical protein